MTETDKSPGPEQLLSGLDALHAGISCTAPDPSLMPRLVQARDLLRSAMNHLEDHDPERFSAAHVALDQLGGLLRSDYPESCVLAFRDGVYWQECPVALAHNRVGLSPRIRVIASHCSICEQDPEECAHVPGRLYDGHRCLSVITEGEIIDVAVVGRPRSPDARITALSLGTSELRSTLGSAFKPGIRVLCDRCLQPCPGLSRQFEHATHA